MKGLEYYIRAPIYIFLCLPFRALLPLRFCLLCNAGSRVLDGMTHQKYIIIAMGHLNQFRHWIINPSTYSGHVTWKQTTTEQHYPCYVLIIQLPRRYHGGRKSSMTWSDRRRIPLISYQRDRRYKIGGNEIYFFKGRQLEGKEVHPQNFSFFHWTRTCSRVNNTRWQSKDLRIPFVFLPSATELFYQINHFYTILCAPNRQL